MSDETYFQQDWLTIPQFKDWLSAGKESTKAYCKRCSKTMNYQIWEYKQLNSHAADKFTLFLSCIML